MPRIVIAERDHTAAEMRRAARRRRETHRVQAQPPRQRQRQAVGQLQGVLAAQGQIVEAARGDRVRPHMGDAVQGIRHHITRPQSARDEARARMQRQRHGRGGERQPHRRPGDGNAQAAGPGTCTETSQRRIQRHALARGKIDAAGGAGDPLPAAHAVRGHDIQIGRQRRHVQHRAALGDQVTATGVDGDTAAGQHVAPQPPERIWGNRRVAGRQQARRRRQPDTLAAIERVVAARPGRRQRDAARRRQQAAGDRQTVGRRQGQPALGIEFDGGAGFHRQGTEQRTAGAQGKLSRCPLRQRLQADFGKRHHIAAAAGERNVGRRQQVLLARLQVCAAGYRQAVGATHRIRGKAATGEESGIQVQHPRLARRRPTDLHLAGAQRQGTAAGNAVTEQLTVQAQLTGLRSRNAIGRKAPNRQADTAALTAFEPAVRAYLTTAGDVDQTAAAQGQVGHRTERHRTAVRQDQLAPGGAEQGIAPQAACAQAHPVGHTQTVALHVGRRRLFSRRASEGVVSRQADAAGRQHDVLPNVHFASSQAQRPASGQRQRCVDLDPAVAVYLQATETTIAQALWIQRQALLPLRRQWRRLEPGHEAEIRRQIRRPGGKTHRWQQKIGVRCIGLRRVTQHQAPALRQCARTDLQGSGDDLAAQIGIQHQAVPQHAKGAGVLAFQITLYHGARQGLIAAGNTPLGIGGLVHPGNAAVEHVRAGVADIDQAAVRNQLGGVQDAVAVAD